MRTTDRPVDVTVRLDKAMSGRFDEIVRALKDEGLMDIQAHRSFLIVNGRIAPEQLEVLRAVAGVQAVRQDATYGAIAGDSNRS